MAGIDNNISFSYEENKACSEALLEEKIQNINNNCLRDLENFLHDQFNYKTATRVNATNTIDQKSKYTWAFPNDVFAQLMYHIEECRKGNCVLHFSERQQYEDCNESGLMFDFDCLYKVPKPVVEKTTKLKFIEAIMSIIIDTLDLHTGSRNNGGSTKIGIIERPRSSFIENKGLYKMGLHLLIPGVMLTRPHKRYIISEIRKSTHIEKILTEMGVVNGLSACDENSASVPVFFIGSCKTNGGIKYELTGIYESTMTPGYIRLQEINDTKLLSKYNLCYEFCLTREAQYKDNMAPLVKKIVYKPATSLEIKINDNFARAANGLLSDFDLTNIDNKVNALVHSSPEALCMQGYLSILDSKYYTEYNLWRDVVFALANSSNGGINYYDLAVWFSQKNPEKWNQGGEAALKDLWETARIRSMTGMGNGARMLTDRSISYWARLSDPVRHAQITQNNYHHKLYTYAYDYDGQIENSMVASIVFAMLKHKFVVDYEGKQPIWMEFITDQDFGISVGEIWKWRKEPGQPLYIQSYITDKLPKVFKEVIKRISDKRDAVAGDKAKSKHYADIIKQLRKSQLKLFNNIFKERTMKECVTYFLQRGFTKKLDVSCPNVLGVGNGLLEMGKSVRFIDYYHELAISKYTVVPWKGKMDPNNPDAFQLKLLNMVGDIIIENDARIKLMMFLSTGLVGGVKNLPLLLGNGGGANGKTVLMSLMIETLGKDVYSSFINPMIYSRQPESADKPNSSLMQLKGKTFTVGEETNKHDVLSGAALKAVIKSGGTSSRDLNQKQESFQIMATQVVMSQYPFTVHDNDHGLWRRIMLYIFRTKFCGNPDPNNIFETKDDPKCRDMATDKNYQIAWLQILVYFYEWFQEVYDGNYDNVPSPTIDIQTETFRNEMDKINQFIYKFVVLSPKYATEGQEASLESVGLKFLKWHDTHYGAKKQTLSEVVKDFENSAIQKHLRRNRTGAYETYGIRVLDEKEYLREGEIYFKPRNEGYRPHKDKIPFWWKRPDMEIKVGAETVSSTETKTPNIDLVNVTGLRSEKSIIAAEHGDDKDFIDVKKKPESPKKDDGYADLLDELLGAD